MKAQFTSGTHYCEGQRLQSFYTSWENPKYTTYMHHQRSYMATFHKTVNNQHGSSLIEWAAVLPTVPSTSHGLDLPTTHVPGTVPPCHHTSYVSLLVSISLVCTRYCSMLDQGAIIETVLNRLGRATVTNTSLCCHILYMHMSSCPVLTNKNILNHSLEGIIF